MKKLTLVASAVSLILTMPTSAFAAPQEAQTTEAEPGQAKIERIEVTGSRIRRTEMEGVAAVTVITAEDLEQSGFTSMEDLLQASIGNTGRTIEGNESSWTQGAHTINLKGMGANRTLDRK